MTTEMKTQPQKPAAGVEPQDLDPNALAAIRNLIETEPQAAPQPVEDRMAEKAVRATATAAPARPKTRPIPARPAQPEMDQYEPGPYVASDPEPAASYKPKARTPKAGYAGGLKARITGYRPTPRHLILGSLALLVLLRPWLVLAILFFGVFVMVGVFLILGYDGFWRRAMGLGRWYARRRPNRAAELHRKLDAFAMKWDAVLDRFPEGSVDGLYLPDFGELATADARHDEALDRRFANLRKGEA